MRCRRGLIAGVLVVLAAVAPARANPIYLGSDPTAISFGVTSYGAPVPGVPTYIANNVTGLNDILSSPGGTFQTANPVIANNIASYLGNAAPFGAFQIGGGNGNGAFGASQILITGPQVGFAISDSNPGGGAASYGIASWSADFFDPVGYNGSFGTYLSVAGAVTDVNSSAVAALRTTITSANPLSPFFGGVTLPQLVLAIANLGGGNYSFVALGGSGAAMLLDNAATGAFRGLAINNANVVIPAGDTFTATTTLTIYADPASIDSLIDITPDLLFATGTTLPSVSLSDTAVPEPGSVVLLGLGLAGVVGYRWRRGRAGARPA